MQERKERATKSHKKESVKVRNVSNDQNNTNYDFVLIFFYPPSFLKGAARVAPSRGIAENAAREDISFP